jgi:pyroglutamyl-peptidase
VRIFKLGPVRVNYEVVRELVPKIWDGNGNGNDDKNGDGDGDGNGDVLAAGHRKFDFVIHIGMAGNEPHYDIERRGHRDGYISTDVDGKFLEDETRHAKEGEKWIWHGVPRERGYFPSSSVLLRLLRSLPYTPLFGR